jgi:hypothetical protein
MRRTLHVRRLLRSMREPRIAIEMRRETKLLGLLSIGIVLAGCGEGPPPRYPLPSNALVGPAQKAQMGEAVEITMEPVTTQTLKRYPSLAVPLRWHEPPLGPTLRPDSGVLHERVVSAVPLPAMWMRIENHGAGTVHFGCAQLALTSADGKSWPIVIDREEIERLAVERVLAEERTLALMSQKTIATLDRDPGKPHPVAVIREATARAPIFDPAMTVPPGGAWQGVVAFDISPEDIAALEQVVDGAKLSLQLACAQIDQTPLATANFSFRLRPAREGGGACVEEYVVYGARRRATEVAFIDGRRVANIDLSNALVAQPVSRRPGKRAMALRGVGIAAIAAGILGAVVTTAALGSTGYTNEAPAGLSMLGLSVGGGIMTYFGYREHKDAIERYNQHAAATGICPRPN